MIGINRKEGVTKNTNPKRLLRREQLLGSTLAVQGLGAFTAVGPQAQSLVRELRPHKPLGMAERKNF